MALTIDKSGKVINKHLIVPIETINKALENNSKKEIQKRILKQVSKMKFNRIVN